VIRMIGRDCFKNINAAGHIAVVAQFRQEERNQRNIDFLLTNLGVVPEAIRVIDRAIATVRDVDAARRILSTRLADIIKFNVWHDIRADGMLKTHGQRTEHFLRPDGTEGSRVVPVLQPYGRLVGHIMLDPNAHPRTPKIEAALKKLRTLHFGENFQARVAEMDDGERHRAANSLAKPIAIARELFAEIEECRRFLSAESIATINGWGRHPESPAQVYLEVDQRSLLIGRMQGGQTQRMPLGDAIHNVLGELPSIGKTA
jgi:hypothetical protein